MYNYYHLIWWYRWDSSKKSCMFEKKNNFIHFTLSFLLKGKFFHFTQGLKQVIFIFLFKQKLVFKILILIKITSSSLAKLLTNLDFSANSLFFLDNWNGGGRPLRKFSLVSLLIFESLLSFGEKLLKPSLSLFFK